MTDEYSVTIERVVPVSAKALFSAWVDPEAIKQFMFPKPGVSISHAQVDPRPGGRFSITMSVGDDEVPIHGEYQTFSEYDKLAFTWLSPHVGTNSFVTVTFDELSAGQTRMILRHDGLETEQQRDNHDGGWNAIVDNLIRLVD